MNTFKDKVLAAAVGGVAAGVVAKLADYLKSPASVTLGLSLAVFGLVEKLSIEGRRTSTDRRALVQSLKAFFDQLRTRENTPPLWSELQRQISMVYEFESDQRRRRLLHEALSEVVRLSIHSSFIAIQEAETTSLLQLKESMGGS